MTDWKGETIAELCGALARRETTSVALTEWCLDRIATLNPRLNAFITVTADRALAAAHAADRARSAGEAVSALHGIPLSLKDLIDEAGIVTSAGSRVRHDVVAAADATVTTRLRAAGAVLVGKTNLHEFAFGTTTEDSGYGAARNPVDDSRVAGGSSGGSAIAVATGMSIASVGSDTGGSIRIPAAACGVVGLKPGWGEIPTDGVVPLSRQLDHLGPIARTVADAWLVHETLAGRAPAAGAALEARPLAGQRLGLLRGYFAERIDPEVEAVFDAAVEALRRAGAVVEPVEIPHVRDIGPVYLHLVLADAAAWHAETLERRPADYTPNVRIRLEMGRYVLAEDYVRALRGREVIAREIDHALDGRAALLCPTLPVPAPPLGAVMVDVGTGAEPVRNAMLRLTQPFNVGRQPALTVPCGMTRAAGMPVGIQLAGASGHTSALLQIGLSVERALARMSAL
jgi:aspartyl-tRNA(Asn)/glutamyl-tRNA(Gln) amidotransferase subunit A